MTKQAAVVITSIALPTRAVEVYAGFDSVKTIVIGDRKTPDNWRLKDVIFLSVEDQIDKYKSFGSRLPVNHYSRKNIGYLEAIRWGCEVIVDTDDDNIPLSDWHIPERSFIEWWHKLRTYLCHSTDAEDNEKTCNTQCELPMS